MFINVYRWGRGYSKNWIIKYDNTFITKRKPEALPANGSFHGGSMKFYR